MEFCITHGWSHYPDETDSVTTVGDELDCRIETWDNVVTGKVLRFQCEQPKRGFFTLAAGNLAYLDTRSGLVPVKVASITDTEAEVKVTAGRPGFKRGETLHLRVPNMTLVNRHQVIRARGKYIIEGPLRLVTDEGEEL